MATSTMLISTSTNSGRDCNPPPTTSFVRQVPSQPWRPGAHLRQCLPLCLPSSGWPLWLGLFLVRTLGLRIGRSVILSCGSGRSPEPRTSRRSLQRQPPPPRPPDAEFWRRPPSMRGCGEGRDPGWQGSGWLTLLGIEAALGEEPLMLLPFCLGSTGNLDLALGG
jgi:hypothetical protein